MADHWCVVVSAGAPDGPAEERDIGQAGAGEHQLGQTRDRAAEAGVGEWNGPDQQLGEIDVGAESPGERVFAEERQRQQPDESGAMSLPRAHCAAGYEGAMTAE